MVSEAPEGPDEEENGAIRVISGSIAIESMFYQRVGKVEADTLIEVDAAFILLNESLQTNTICVPDFVPNPLSNPGPVADVEDVTSS
ncbi:hypothetical protein M0R45_025260 [Rubus argutus]|uniref:Uncharacterized protein n=1 Tax=Rubus argutus TaxID=59490 RepID=A0AAW1WWK7_RUBAR